MVIECGGSEKTLRPDKKKNSCVSGYCEKHLLVRVLCINTFPQHPFLSRLPKKYPGLKTEIGCF